MRSRTQIQSEIKRNIVEVTDTFIMRELSSLCLALEYGDINSALEIDNCISHRVFYVKTESAELIIKQLSSKMLSIPHELAYHINSQKIAQIAHASGIPTIIAKENQERISVSQCGCNYYMVYDYHPQAIKTQNELTQDDCFKVGYLLARIHSVNFSSLVSAAKDGIRTLAYNRVKSFLRRYIFNEVPSLLRVYRCILFLFIQERVQLANSRIQQNVISHCDLTHNNVLWLNATSPCVIDWDAAGYTNIEKDIMQTIYAWCFCGSTFNLTFLNSFLDGYMKKTSHIQVFSKQACLAALSEDVECLDSDLDPKIMDGMIVSIIAKWRNIRKIRCIIQRKCKEEVRDVSN